MLVPVCCILRQALADGISTQLPYENALLLPKSVVIVDSCICVTQITK